MIEFIRGLKKRINEEVQVILMIVALLFALYNTFSTIGTVALVDIFNFLELVLVFAAFAYLIIEKKLFVGHVVLLVLFFANAPFTLFTSLFSLTFSPFGLAIPLTGQTIVNFIIFGYLALMIFSYLLNGGLKTNSLKGKTVGVVAIFLIVQWIFAGFNGFMLLTVVLGLILLYGIPKSALLIVLSSLLSSVYISIASLFSGFVLLNLIIAVVSLALLLYAFLILMEELGKPIQLKNK